ncbi:MAG: hypothetical protein AB4206_10590 [Xenococcaceae cyanobacterium]
MKTQNQIIEQGYKALVDSLGIIDTIRFIQYFSPGEGNYTKERNQWLEQKSVDDVLQDIDKFKQSDLDKYQKIIE